MSGMGAGVGALVETRETGRKRRLRCVTIAAGLVGRVEHPGDLDRLILLAELLDHYVAHGDVDSEVATALTEELERRRGDMVTPRNPYSPD